MNTSRVPVVGRKPIQLPWQTFLKPSASTPDANRSSNSTNANAPKNTESTPASTLVDSLVEFVNRYNTNTTTTAAAAAAPAFPYAKPRPRNPMTIPFHGPSRQPPTTVQGVDASSSPRSTHNDAIDVSAEGAADATSPTLVQRVLSCTEAFADAEARLARDEGYFSDAAETERCVMRHLREWRQYVDTEDESRNSGDSVSGSRRTSSVYGGTFGEAATRPSSSYCTRTISSGVGSKNDPASGVGSGGVPRVQADLECVQQCTAIMAELHATLTTLEDEHRGLQRHYIVEKTVVEELEALCTRLWELEREAAQLDTATTASSSSTSASPPSSSKWQRRPQRGATSGRRQAGKRVTDAVQLAAVHASLAACRTLADQLRTRASAVAERLTDELLWMRSEVRRHDFSVVRTATALTRMEPVSVAMGGTGGSATNIVSPTATTTTTAAAAVCPPQRTPRSSLQGGVRGSIGKENEEDPIDDVAGSRGSSTVSSSATDFSNLGEGDSDGSPRDSFLLRVQVPVFVSATAPPLRVLCESPTRLSSGSSKGIDINKNSFSNGRPSRGTVGNAMSDKNNNSLTLHGSARRPSSGGAASAAALVPPTAQSTATVSVIATPARYALVQLYEACCDFMRQMLTRLSHLRARRSAVAAQLQAEQQELDAYDPAADELRARLDAVVQYEAQLEGYMAAVQAAHQILHEQVKLPMDASLQTYERFRTQLLEVLKQRLEQAEEEEAAAAAAAADGASHENVYSDDEQRATSRSTATQDHDSTQQLADGEEGEEDEQQQRHQSHGSELRQTSTASLGHERARRSTQSPQALLSASSSPLPSAPPLAARADPDLPRASAEFIGMLDTLLKSQQKAASEAADAVATTSVKGGEMRGSVAARQVVESAVEALPGGASRAAEDATLRDAPGMASSAVQRMACRRRPRCSDDESAERASRSDATGAENGRATLRTRRTADTTEPRREAKEEEVGEQRGGVATVIVSSSSTTTTATSDSGEKRGVDVDAMTAAAAATVVSDSTASDDEEDEGDDDGTATDDSHAKSSARPRPSEPRRYGLGSEDGFRGGLRAFFTAVARRVMDFGDSDDDDDYDGGDRHNGSAEQQRKRARHE
jgi:hypothetical protein